jgi:hypothetical protein
MPALHVNSHWTAIIWNVASAKQILLMMGTLPGNTKTRDLHMVFKIPYLHDFITKLIRQQATVVPTHENVNIPNIGQDKTQHKV